MSEAQGDTDGMDVQVVPCPFAARQVFKNLFVFYQYDLMPSIPDGPGSHVSRWGVINDDTSRTHTEAFAGDSLWHHPAAIFPFLTYADGALAGLALVTKPPFATPGRDWRLDEFFILNKFRGLGVGRRAAFLLFDRFRGRWELGELPANAPAIAFWTRVVGEYTGGHFESVLLQDSPDETPYPGHAFDNSG